MKELPAFRLLAVVLLLGCGGCEVRHSREPTQPIMKAAPILAKDIAFNGSGFLCLLTSHANIIFTADRGKTWERILNPGPELVGGETEFERIAFPNDYHGWAITTEGVVCHTTDRGRHWMKLGDLDVPDLDDFGPPLQIRFIDEQHGWIIDPFNVWKTEDGGIGWRHCSVPREPLLDGLFAGVYFNNALKAWLYGTRGKVWRTVDGGQTWYSQVVVPADRDILSLFFSSERVGWITTKGGKDGKGIYKTTDGGASWVLRELPETDPQIRSVHFISEDEGWLAGAGASATTNSGDPIEGLLLHTTDGGSSWERVHVNSEEPYFDRLFFADSMHGWVVALNHVYATDDGGETWYTALNATGEQFK